MNLRGDIYNEKLYQDASAKAEIYGKMVVSSKATDARDVVFNIDSWEEIIWLIVRGVIRILVQAEKSVYGDKI